MASMSMWATLIGAWKAGYIAGSFGPFAGLQLLIVVSLFVRPSRRYFGLICPRCNGMAKPAGWLGQQGCCWLCDIQWD